MWKYVSYKLRLCGKTSIALLKYRQQKTRKQHEANNTKQKQIKVKQSQIKKLSKKKQKKNKKKLVKTFLYQLDRLENLLNLVGLFFSVV